MIHSSETANGGYRCQLCECVTQGEITPLKDAMELMYHFWSVHHVHQSQMPEYFKNAIWMKREAVQPMTTSPQTPHQLWTSSPLNFSQQFQQQAVPSASQATNNVYVASPQIFRQMPPRTPLNALRHQTMTATKETTYRTSKVSSQPPLYYQPRTQLGYIQQPMMSTPRAQNHIHRASRQGPPHLWAHQQSNGFQQQARPVAMNQIPGPYIQIPPHELLRQQMNGFQKQTLPIAQETMHQKLRSLSQLPLGKNNYQAHIPSVPSIPFLTSMNMPYIPNSPTPSINWRDQFKGNIYPTSSAQASTTCMSNPVTSNPVMSNPVMSNHIMGNPVNPVNPANVMGFVDQSSDSGMNDTFNEGLGGCNINKLPFIQASTTKKDVSVDPAIQTNDTSVDKLFTLEELGGFDVVEPLPVEGLDNFLEDVSMDDFDLELNKPQFVQFHKKLTEPLEEPSFVDLLSALADLPEKSLQVITPPRSVASASPVVLAEENIQAATSAYDLEPVPASLYENILQPIAITDPVFDSSPIVLPEESLETTVNATSDFAFDPITLCENETVQEVVVESAKLPESVVDKAAVQNKLQSNTIKVPITGGWNGFFMDWNEEEKTEEDRRGWKGWGAWPEEEAAKLAASR